MYIPVYKLYCRAFKLDLPSNCLSKATRDQDKRQFEGTLRRFTQTQAVKGSCADLDVWAFLEGGGQLKGSLPGNWG